jgi:hypothetical protein
VSIESMKRKLIWMPSLFVTFLIGITVLLASGLLRLWLESLHFHSQANRGDHVACESSRQFPVARWR